MLNLEYTEERRVIKVARIPEYRAEIYQHIGRHYWLIRWFDVDVASGWSSSDYGARVRIEEIIEEDRSERIRQCRLNGQTL
jgi:hypothetical protein